MEVITKNKLRFLDVRHAVLLNVLRKPNSIMMAQVTTSNGQRNPGEENVLFIMIVLMYLLKNRKLLYCRHAGEV